jgi:hypothetical protein
MHILHEKLGLTPQMMDFVDEAIHQVVSQKSIFLGYSDILKFTKS